MGKACLDLIIFLIIYFDLEVLPIINIFLSLSINLKIMKDLIQLNFFSKITIINLVFIIYLPETDK